MVLTRGGLSLCPKGLSARQRAERGRQKSGEDWPQIVEWLRMVPEIEAKTLFEYWLEQHPDRY